MAHETQDVDAAAKALRELVSTVPMFNGFPEEVVNELKDATRIVQVMPEDTILKQGEINKNLYFLLLGTVDVFVDGGLVASMRRKGDLLGEMSVITKKPCSATIVAKTPVELICVNTEEFKRITGSNKDQFDYVLYRIYSMILTDKVHITNQKAKRLEETLESLQRAQKDLVEINAQMERRVVERTQAVQEQLGALLKKNLEPLSASLFTAEQAADTKTKEVLQQCRDEVKESIRVLEPIIDRFNAEVSMKNKKILIAIGDRKSQTVAKAALGGTGAQIEATANIDEIRAKTVTGEFDLVLLDDATLASLPELERAAPTSKFLFSTPKTLQESLPTFLSMPTLPNICCVDGEDREAHIRMIATTVTKLVSADPYGLEKYLNVGVNIPEIAITRSDERGNYIGEVRSYFSKLGVRSSILDSVSVVLEEMLMNAIYDAPVDRAGKSLYNHLPRTQVLELKGDEQGRLRFASDGAHLAVSVEDPFGALTGKVIMKYLDSCYGGRAGEMNKEKGGAGRGLHQIVESADFVVYNVTPGRRTEAIAVFDLIPDQSRVKHPMLHFFVHAAN